MTGFQSPTSPSEDAGESEIERLRREVAELRAANAALLDAQRRDMGDALTIRDHIIGLEAGLDTATRRADEATARAARQAKRLTILRDRVERLRERAVRAERQLARSQGSAALVGEELAAMQRSRSWRVTRVLRRSR